MVEEAADDVRSREQVSRPDEVPGARELGGAREPRGATYVSLSRMNVRAAAATELLLADGGHGCRNARHGRTRARTDGRTDERMSKQASERASERTNERAGERACERTTDTRSRGAASHWRLLAAPLRTSWLILATRCALAYTSLSSPCLRLACALPIATAPLCFPRSLSLFSSARCFSPCLRFSRELPSRGFRSAVP